MKRPLLLIILPVLFIDACIRSALPPVEVTPRAQAVSYLDEVQPIFAQRCAVCHSCYNAACQLKLSSRMRGSICGGSKALGLQLLRA